MNEFIEISENEKKRQNQVISDAVQEMAIVDDSTKWQEEPKPKEEGSRVENLIKDFGL